MKPSYTLIATPWSTLVVAIIGVAISLDRVSAYMIHVDSGVENECYHEKVNAGTKLGFSFEVIEGGFYDIDVEIKDPANVIIHQDERATNGKFTLEANTNGDYQLCFSNKKSSYTPKIILFDITKSETKASPQSNGDETKEGEEAVKMANMVEGLLLATISARQDVRYLTARDKVHRKVNDSTNSTIVWWSGVEFILLLSVTLGQVWYLKRFFEIRRKA